MKQWLYSGRCESDKVKGKAWLDWNNMPSAAFCDRQQKE
jgi:hypothetical protein